MNVYIENFSGGIVNKLHSKYNKVNTAIDMLNCDVTDGTLKSSKGFDFTPSETAWPYIIGDDTYSVDKDTYITQVLNSIVTLKDGTLTLYKNGVTHTIPKSKPSASIALNPGSAGQEDGGVYTLHELLSDKDIAADGPLQFGITYYNPSTNYETKPLILAALRPSVSGGIVGDTLTKDEVRLLQERGFIDNVVIDGSYISTASGLSGLNSAESDAIYNFMRTFTGEIPVSQRDDLFYTAYAVVQDAPGEENRLFHYCSYRTRDILEDFTDQQRTDMYKYFYDHNIALNTKAFTYFTKQIPKRYTISVDSLEPGWEIRIYRFGPFRHLGANTEYMLYTTTTDLTITLDSDTDIGEILTTLDNIEDLNPKYLTSSNNTLFIADENKVWFTDLGTWTIKYSNYLLFDSDVTSIYHLRDFTIVTTVNNSVYSIVGDSVTTFKVLKLADDIDCVHAKTMCGVDNNVVWLSSVGLVATNGYTVQPLHKYTITSETFVLGDLYGSASVLTDYYLLIDNFIYKYDMQINQLTKYSSQEIETLYMNRGKIYGALQSQYGILFAGNELPLFYHTNLVAQPKHYYTKMYGQVRLLYKGQMLITVRIDNSIVNSVQLELTDKPKEVVFSLNAEMDVGHEISIVYDGTGVVYDTEITFDLGDTL